MTDARLRGEWYGMLRYEQLSDSAWRVFTNALMFCAQNGTDGFIPSPFQFKLHPYGAREGMIAELESAGLWTKQGDDGYQLTGWDTELGQSTAAEVDAYKTNARERQRKFREKTRTALEKENAKQVTRDVTRDATSPVTRDVGKGKGKGKGDDHPEVNGPQFEPEVDQNTGEVFDAPQQESDDDWWAKQDSTSTSDWPVVSIPNDSTSKSDSTSTCRVCSQPVKSLDAWGLCSKVTAPHVAARKEKVAA